MLSFYVPLCLAQHPFGTNRMNVPLILLQYVVEVLVLHILFVSDVLDHDTLPTSL